MAQIPRQKMVVRRRVEGSSGVCGEDSKEVGRGIQRTNPCCPPQGRTASLEVIWQRKSVWSAPLFGQIQKRGWTAPRWAQDFSEVFQFSDFS